MLNKDELEKLYAQLIEVRRHGDLSKLNEAIQLVAMALGESISTSDEWASES